MFQFISRRFFIGNINDCMKRIIKHLESKFLWLLLTRFNPTMPTHEWLFEREFVMNYDVGMRSDIVSNTDVVLHSNGSLWF